MVGMFCWTDGKAVGLKERSILRVRFLCAELRRGAKTPETVLRRRVTQAGKRLKKQGVTRVVLPEGFPYQEQLKKLGLQPVSTVSLRKAIAADWVRWILEERGMAIAGARVAVCAQRMTGEVVRAVTELALRHRYVLLSTPYGGEELSHQLRREYGVSLLLEPSQEQLESAEVLVLFDEQEGFPTALRLYDEASPLPPLLLPLALEEKLPTGIHRGQLLSVLRENGVLRPGQIVVGTPVHRQVFAKPPP